jgi:HrpA-like RNA helicase
MAVPTLLKPGMLRLADGTAVAEAPIEYVVGWLRRRMPEFGYRRADVADRVFVLRSETGSGKSTILPVGMFRLLRSERTSELVEYRGHNVICTQPRVMTAIALAKDVSSRAWNPDMKLGATVGYTTGPNKIEMVAGLVYATAGTLVVQLRQQADVEIMHRYRFIVVDEAHERSVDGDLLLMLLKNFYLRNVGNPHLPFMVLTSATIDPHKYAAYFGVGLGNIALVAGRAYPIATHWAAAPFENYVDGAVATVAQIHTTHLDDLPLQADILIFVPGAAETAATEKALTVQNERWVAAGVPPILVLAINREVIAMQSIAYRLAFAPLDQLPSVLEQSPKRRCIVSTVVAETGLTIDTLKYVIDCGWQRNKETYQPEGVVGLITRPAPKSRVEQRKGRVGRLFGGEFYPMYTEDAYRQLDDDQLPDIISTGFDEICLSVIREQQHQKLFLCDRERIANAAGGAPGPPAAAAEFRLEDIALLDPPPVHAWLSALSKASVLGFVGANERLPSRWPPDFASDPSTARGYGLTALGFVASMFARLSLESVRILMAGLLHGVAMSDLLTVVSMCMDGHSKKEALMTKRERMRHPVLAGYPAGSAAVRAALPGFLRQRLVVGGGRWLAAGEHAAAMPPADSEMFFYRSRLLVDDFIELILIVHAFMAQVRIDDFSVLGSGALTPPSICRANAWCNENGLNYEAMIRLLKQRELAIEEMIIAGLDPTANSAHALSVQPISAFTAQVVLIKRCLYDGLRHNVLRFNAERGQYQTASGHAVSTPAFLRDDLLQRLHALHPEESRRALSYNALRPQWILTDTIGVAALHAKGDVADNPAMYAVEAGLVCVLDGFVDIDTTFTMPRHF